MPFGAPGGRRPAREIDLTALPRRPTHPPTATTLPRYTAKKRDPHYGRAEGASAEGGRRSQAPSARAKSGGLPGQKRFWPFGAGPKTTWALSARTARPRATSASGANQAAWGLAVSAQVS